jgi:nicotinate-nucleotide adenylyltransferase
MQTKKTPRLGILGGTFNPVHTGHLILAQTALESFDLDRILFIPCATPPHKDSLGLASAEHRLNMLRAATEDNLHFEVSDMELHRGGISYSVDTLIQLHATHPDTRFFFIVGSDSLVELHLWHQVYRLLDLCDVITLQRPGHSVRESDIQLDPPWPKRLLQRMRPGRLIAISSSEIRYRLAEGMAVTYLVPACVEMYIAEHRLYRT